MMKDIVLIKEGKKYLHLSRLEAALRGSFIHNSFEGCKGCGQSLKWIDNNECATCS